jgi:23S rRNA pseudouridine1911/1915/1917 synthase
VSARERFVVAVEDAGLRLDQVLAKCVPGLSRRRARVLVDMGAVFVDRARVKVASRPVQKGQVIEAVLGAALDGRAAEDGPPPRIVFEDDDVLVVDKPPGLVTAPTPESDRGNLLELLSRTRTKVWLVHRIDRETSGLLVFAKTADANRTLGDRFVVHDIERAYVAVVAGLVSDDAGTIDAPIDGRRAVTHFEVTERVGGATVLRCRLETGRGHQIRIHLAGRGHPVLGDTKHGAEVARRFTPRPPRLALHATLLGFAHPRTGEKLCFEAPVPEDLSDWLSRVRGAR